MKEVRSWSPSVAFSIIVGAAVLGLTDRPWWVGSLATAATLAVIWTISKSVRQVRGNRPV